MDQSKYVSVSIERDRAQELKEFAATVSLNQSAALGVALKVTALAKTLVEVRNDGEDYGSPEAVNALVDLVTMTISDGAVKARKGIF